MAQDSPIPLRPLAVGAAAAAQALRPLHGGLEPAAASAAGVPLWQLLDEAAQAVQAVRGGKSLGEALARVPAALRPGVQALSFHGLRWLGSAQVLREQLVPKPPAPAVDGLLLLALALLWPGEPPPYPEHTLVDQAVTAVRRRAPPAAGFVNAVLRRFLRERDTLVAAVRRTPLGAWNHPEWWVERLRRDWPQHWQALLQAANQRPPFTLRVNARRSSGAEWLQRAQDQGRPGRLLPGPLLAGQAVQMAQPCPVERLPGFVQGEVSVQDAAAQQAVGLLLAGTTLGQGARVLDACAAPGGKTAQLLERCDAQVLALDSDAHRLQRVHETLQRLGLQDPQRCRLAAADARHPAAWWDGQAFDAIVLDAPCTASGIVRRHPDIRWLRRPEDIGALARMQAELLDALWPLLRPGGRLVYATCSVFRAEGQAQVDAFLQRLPPGAARLDPASPGHLLPLADNPPHAGASAGPPPAADDGFYIALLHKT